MTNTCILTLIAPPEVEEKLLDHLLMSSASQLFTSHPVACHGTVVPHRNPQSQVLGRHPYVLRCVLTMQLPINFCKSFMRSSRVQACTSGFHP